MMNNKMRYLCYALLMLLCVLIGLGFYAYKMYDARDVLFLPDGFIELEEAVASSDERYRFVFWESQISVMSENVCIYQTSIRDKNFILKYKGKYYINYVKLYELIS